VRAVTLTQLIEILGRYNGSAIVVAVTRTQPRLLVKSRADGTPTADKYPHGVEKLTRQQMLLANCYEDNVVQQRRREGHPRPRAFKASALWRGKGSRLGKFLVRHVDDDRLYLRARPKSDDLGQPVRLWERWIDLGSGCDLTGEALEELKTFYLRDVPSANRKQQLNCPVPYRTYHVISIDSIKVGGEVYTLKADRCPFTYPAT
jgi:hypothetical protein